jgi:hypothetical protein
VDVTDVSAWAGIVSASGSTIVAVSTITGVGSRRPALVSTQPMILGFVVPANEISTKLPVGEEVVARAAGVLHPQRWETLAEAREPADHED